MTTLKTLTITTALTAALTFSPLGATENSRKIPAQLSNLELFAANMAAEADHLEGLTASSGISWESYSVSLTEMKDSIDHAGRLLAKLQGERVDLTAEEQKAIDSAYPRLKEAAARTTDSIEHLNASKSDLWTGPYRDDAESVYKDGKIVAKIMRDVQQLEKTRSLEQHAEQSLTTDTGF
jgi:hypothetical protein